MIQLFNNIKMKSSDFKIISKLGQGSFGDVILVERIKDRKRMAQKKILLNNSKED